VQLGTYRLQFRAFQFGQFSDDFIRTHDNTVNYRRLPLMQGGFPHAAPGSLALFLAVVNLEQRVGCVEQRLTLFIPRRQLTLLLRLKFFDGGFDFLNSAHDDNSAVFLRLASARAVRWHPNLLNSYFSYASISFFNSPKVLAENLGVIKL
jgi:hypothetical protein